MTKRGKLEILVGAGVVAVIAASVVLPTSPTRPRIAHQRPYAWDAYYIPLLEFDRTRLKDVVDIVDRLSGGVDPATVATEDDEV